MRAVIVAGLLLAAVPASAAPEPPMVVAGAPVRAARPTDELRLAAGWRALRDRDTGVALRMWGGFVEVPGAMRDPAVAERAARAFVAAHAALLAPGARPDDLVLAANRVDGGLRTVVLHQAWRGMRVVGGSVHVVFGNDRLFVAGSDALPDVAVAGAAGPRAPVAAAVAWLARETGLPGIAARPTGERVVLPIVRGRGAAIGAASGEVIEYRLADVFDARAATAAGRWWLYVAPDGAPLARASRVRFADSTLRFEIGARYPGGARIAAPAPRAHVVIDGAAAATGDDASFSWPGAAPATVVTGALGDRVAITTATGAPATATLTAQPGQPLVWSLAGDETGDAQLVAYAAGSLAKLHARRIQPGLAWLDQPLSITVNHDDEACNAFSSGDDLHFYRASAACENTARVVDVVLHEFGHSFHLQSSIFEMAAIAPALGEGAADFFAANITEDPAIGRGFRFTDAPVRDLDPLGHERVYPADVTSSPHATGLILGGALWDLRRALIAQLGDAAGRARAEAIYLGIVLRASDLPSSYVAALTGDDDDGDLGNGTPNRCAIELAFGRHGLAGAEFRTTTIGPHTVDGLAIAVPVAAVTGTACPQPRVTAMTVTWRVGEGAPAEVALALDGATWRGAIPPQPAGTVVAYQLAATFEDGQRTLLPDNAADPWYQLFAGDAEPIWCERFEVDPQWTVTGQPEWQVAAPLGLAGDPAAAYAGASALGNDLRGDGEYRRGVTTAIETPPIDVSGYERVHLQFRRWLTVEDGGFDRAAVRAGGAELWRNAADANGALDHVDREWRFVDLDVTAQRGDALVIAWTLATDNSNQRGGWTIDDVCVVGIGKLDDPEGGGCCSAGGSPTGPIALSLGLGLAMFRRRRLPRRLTRTEPGSPI